MVELAMEKFMRVINGLDLQAIKQEVSNTRTKNSATLNQALKIAYPAIKKGGSKTILLKIWNNLIKTAAKPREGTISRIWLKLYEALDKVIQTLYDNENTSESVITEFRKILRNKYGDNSEIYKQSIYKTGITQQRSKERKEEYSNKVNVRNTERGGKQPIYIEDILSAIQKLKRSNDPYEQSLAVLLATGSRSIELFKVSKYYEVKDDPTVIDIKGISKDKGNRGYANITIQRPLVGLTSAEVVDLVNEIRDELNVKGSNMKIANATNTALNKAFQENIQPLAPDFKMTSHKCRYIYGNVSYLLFGKPKKIPYESWVQQVLAHSSAESTKSYLGINIQFREKIVRQAPDDIKSLFESEIRQIKQQVDRNCPNKIEVDLTPFKNSFRRGVDEADKINNVVQALKLIKANKINITQAKLRAELGYSAAVMTKGYASARSAGVM